MIDISYSLDISILAKYWYEAVYLGLIRGFNLLVWIDALSSITIVVLVIWFAKSLKKSITTCVSTFVVVVFEKRWLFLVFKNPRTFILFANLFDGISNGLPMGDQ